VAAPQLLAEKKALIGLPVLLSDFLEHMSARELFSSGFGVLILAGASIIAYWKISDFVKNRSAQNNS
jgi:hypothetical protein